MPWNVLYASGQWAIQLSFTSPAHHWQWAAEVQEIKDRIALINNDGDPGAPRVPRYNAWILYVKNFVRRYGGEGLLPPDIKHAMNDVEINIGVQVTVWEDPPENHLLANFGEQGGQQN